MRQVPGEISFMLFKVLDDSKLWYYMLRQHFWIVYNKFPDRKYLITKYVVLYHNNQIISIINFRTELIIHNYYGDNLGIEGRKLEIIPMVIWSLPAFTWYFCSNFAQFVLICRIMNQIVMFMLIAFSSSC